MITQQAPQQIIVSSVPEISGILRVVIAEFWNEDKSISHSLVPEIEKPVTVKELEEFLGVTEATIIRWRKKGKIPFMQLGSRILFKRSAVLTALENKKKG